MKPSHIVVAIVFFVLGAMGALAYIYNSSLCVGQTPKVGFITEPRNDAAPAAKVTPKTAAFRIETAVNRHGSDYRDYEMEMKAGPELCEKACAEDGKCLAYTFVKAGVQGRGPHCWLKNRVPAPYPDKTCVSGVKL